MPLLRIADRSPSAEGAAELHARRWDEHAQAIYRYCFRRTGDAALAEDLTSIVFLEAWRRSGEVAIADEHALAWLYGVATNVLRNQRRHQRRHRAAVARIPRTPAEPDFSEQVADRLDDERKMHSILASLAKLPRRDREVLGLCVWEELTPSEAALALGLPEATVRTRLHRARRRLRDLAGAELTVTPSPAEGESQ